jgi:hypothetical protein
MLNESHLARQQLNADSLKVIFIRQKSAKAACSDDFTGSTEI